MVDVRPGEVAEHLSGGGNVVEVEFGQFPGEPGAAERLTK
jgi:hypothetical protein